MQQRKFYRGEQSGEEWLQRREQAQLNSSNTGILFGFGYVSRFRYFKEKIGKIKPRDLSNNEYVQHGTIYEQTALDWYRALIEPNNKTIETDHQICLYQGIAGSPDAVSHDTMYEIKCPTYEWEENRNVPIKYMLQLAMNMWLYEKDKGILIIYNVPMDDEDYHNLIVYSVRYNKAWFESYIMPVVYQWIEDVKDKRLDKIPKRYNAKEKQAHAAIIKKNIVLQKIF